MHYIICYGIEDDRLREKTAKTLARHGCSRVQAFNVASRPYPDRD